MIGIVVVTHGNLAGEFLAALEHIVGAQEATAAICIGPDDDMEDRREEIRAAVAEVDRGAGVVLLTDMFGGTPSNLAISIMGLGREAEGDVPDVEVVAGLNLPLLVKLASLRGESDLASAVAAAQDAGRKYISIASKVLAGSDA